MGTPSIGLIFLKLLVLWFAVRFILGTLVPLLFPSSSTVVKGPSRPGQEDTEPTPRLVAETDTHQVHQVINPSGLPETWHSIQVRNPDGTLDREKIRAYLARSKEPKTEFRGGLEIVSGETSSMVTPLPLPEI